MKEFRTKAELFKYLVENKADIIAFKKSALKYSDVVCFSPEFDAEVVGFDKEKGDAHVIVKTKYPYENNEDKGVLKRTIVANTYNWMDSHSDVHLSGIFSESIKQKGTKIFHLNSHVLDFSAKVGKPTAVYEKQISWRELGQGKTGMTEALFVESEIRKSYNETMYNAYLSDEVDQHSVGMQYVKIALAVDDKENYPKEYEEWQAHIGKIGNRQAVEKQGFFFAVHEAKLVEVSAVLLGSNELTPTLGAKTSPPEAFSFKVLDPPESSQKVDLLEAINKLQELTLN